MGLWPGWYTRAAFYTLMLCCMLIDLERFQLVFFVFTIKGFGAISAVLNALFTCFQLWGCGVYAPGTCSATGPGAGVVLSRAVLVTAWMQLITVVAFLLIPLSHTRGRTRALEDARQRALEGKDGNKDAPTQGAGSPGVPKSPPPSQRLGTKRGGTARSATGGFRRLDDDDDGDDDDDDALARPNREAEAHRPLLLRCLCLPLDLLLVLVPKAYRKEKLSYLMAYDLLVFLAVGSLFASVVRRYAEEDATTAAEVVRSSSRAADTFVVLEIAFQLSSFPFLVGKVSFLRDTLSETSPTGYNRIGLAVAEDVGGLSTYVDWLTDVLRGSSVQDSLKPDDLETLHKMLSDARTYLVAHPLKRTQQLKLRDAIDAHLYAILEGRSHPLFKACFPNQLIMLEYIEGRHASGELPPHLYHKVKANEKKQRRAMAKKGKESLEKLLV